MSKELVRIEPSVRLIIEAPRTFNYMAYSWASSVLIALMVLALMGLEDTPLSNVIFYVFAFTLFFSMMFLIILLRLVRKRVEQDVDMIVEGIKRTMKEAVPDE